MSDPTIWIPKIETIQAIRDCIESLIKTEPEKFYKLKALLWDLEVEINAKIEEAVFDYHGDNTDDTDYIDELQDAIINAYNSIR
jgi:hypothetical protein